ncbi:MAG TPA: flagellar hook protein FlgE [Selenomonadales bacterium]|nr:flagellar hook protein FlgE [Selenomonadales bacterium]
MMTSFYSGVSGIKAQQYALDVIANNIANVNTTGYKQQRVSFSDLLSQTISGASGATSTKGGTNAKQIGLGVSIASIDTLMTAGSTQSTGVATDLSIGGSGFFIVQGGSVGKYQFTRNGALDVDEDGNVTINGYKVCGWQAYTVDADGNYVYNTDADVEPLNIYSDSYNGNKKIIAAKASTEATFNGNLDPSATASGTALNDIGTVSDFDQTSTITVYDAQGNSYDVTVNWKKCYVDDTTSTTSWYWELDTTNTSLSLSPASGYVEFDSSGKIITTDATNYNSAPSITMTPSGVGTAAFNVTLDFGDVGTSVSSSTASVTGVADGYESGELQSISISSDGTIIGIYSNDQTQALGMIALATFTNPEGLEKIGNNLYVTSANSGAFTGGVVAGSSGTGSLSSGTLEMSNVDLAEQFSSMMISQRAYQANSKVITASDECLQSLINMIR